MAKVYGGEEHTVTYYRLRFLDSSKEGYSFPCDKNGNVLLNEMNKDSLLNYQHALSHPEFFKIYNEVEELSYRYRDDVKDIMVLINVIIAGGIIIFLVKS